MAVNDPEREEGVGRGDGGPFQTYIRIKMKKKCVEVNLHSLRRDTRTIIEYLTQKY